MEGIANLDLCYQCYACSAGCPVAYAMDYYPHQLIHMVRLGLKEEVLQSRAIWVCNSCETCATRCPNEIDIVRLMDVLRSESFREGSVNEILQFHKVFMKEIQKRGRVHGLQLVFRYKLKGGALFSLRRIGGDISVALKMFFRGKLGPLLPRMREQKEVKEIFNKVLHDK